MNGVQGLPIIFLNYGLNEGLLLCLALAARRNPESSVILLGDTWNNDISGVQYFPFQDYSEEADRLDRIYCHISVYERRFELFCLQRWFILANFMERHRIERCFHADSDVLILGDLSKERAPLPLCDMSLSRGHAGICGHSSFINNRLVLRAFTDFVLTEFEKGADYLEHRLGVCRLLRLFELRQDVDPLNDMHFWRSFRRDSGFQFCDTGRIIGGSTFDHYLGSSHSGFEMERDIKKFVWRNGFPYCFHERLGMAVRFLSIHCQGAQKAHLPELARIALHGGVP